MISSQLFEGENVRFTTIDLEKDPATESGWTHDPRYAAMASDGLPHPLSAFERKKYWEEKLKKFGESIANGFYFAVHVKSDDRLIGFLNLDWISWSNGVVNLSINFGDQEDLQKYGVEVLQMAQVYIFRELNLFRASATVAEFDQELNLVYQQCGFEREVVQRQNIYYAGKTWDLYTVGCLANNWALSREEQK
jgi:RimJ/RimL family protein N-acetyltransferase